MSGDTVVGAGAAGPDGHDGGGAGGPVVRVSAPTELRNPRTTGIDTLPTLDMLRLVNDEDRRVLDAVAGALPDLARAVELTVAAVRGGHRVHYVGAGTSGRLAALDAAELPPTYGVAADLFCAHHAGGAAALDRSAEDAEDDEQAGALQAADVVAGDVVVGLTASGRTPYVAGALRRAAEVGAHTVLVSSAPDAELAGAADVHVMTDTGPEVVAGSTRMKAGTAQKLVLTTFSTAVMVRLGRTYSNLMVAVAPGNAKLRARCVRILVEATGSAEDVCARALGAAGGDVRTALVHLLTGAPVALAADALTRTDGVVRDAVAALSRPAEASPEAPPGSQP